MMKRIAVTLLLALLTTGASYAQEKQKKQKMAAKEHTCSASCKEGSHAYACGEKGHKCTDDCHKSIKKHGEEGHTCTAECKKDMKKAKM